MRQRNFDRKVLRECLSLGNLVSIIDWGRRNRSVYGAIQPHFTKIACPAVDWRKSENSFPNTFLSERFVIAMPHER